MFMSALFVIALNWQLSLYPSTGECLKCHEILLSNKKKQIIDIYTDLDESPGC